MKQLIVPMAVLVSVGCTTDTGGDLPDPHFATKVVSYSPGPCGGFQKNKLPAIVLGPPEGAGDSAGGFDVVSLGDRGEIVLSVEPNAIVDGQGADLVVFENAFFAGGDPTKPNAELAEVSVSDDGATWIPFPCDTSSFPFAGCAGVHPVYSSRGDGISPFDVTKAGGDAFDLSAIGVSRARFIRIRDLGTTECSEGSIYTNAGFDLDALAVIHGEE